MTTAAAGLLGYLATDFDSSRVEVAHRRAPWRGSPSAQITGAIGGIVGLGSALVGCHRHVAVAIHGRIDNLQNLAREFDVEQDNVIAVLGEAYLRFGDEYAGRLLGDFAILILDKSRGVLLGARDWIGARPLFWGEHNGVVAFGSEVKQVLALLDLPYHLDEETAQVYRRLRNPPVTATFAQGVQAIAPSGQILTGVNRGPEITVRPVVFETIDVSMTEATELLRSRMDMAVERRTKGSMRPCAVFSGGMDSTSVAATAAMLAERGTIPPLIAGFGLHFPEVPQSDEVRYARELANQWAIPWYPVAISPQELKADPSELLAIHDGPVYPLVEMFHQMYDQVRTHGADVVLTGQGADYWQDQYGQELVFSVLRREWTSVFTWATYGFRRHPRSTLRRIAKSALAVLQGQTQGDHYADTGTRDWLLRTALEDEERLGQYYGLRVESPFADRELAGALVGLPPRLRSNPEASKLALRAAMADRLPESILKRRDKSVFDPVVVAAFGQPAESQSAGQMAAQHYLVSWRRYLAGGDRYPTKTMGPDV